MNANQPPGSPAPFPAHAPMTAQQPQPRPFAPVPSAFVAPPMPMGPAMPTSGYPGVVVQPAYAQPPPPYPPQPQQAQAAPPVPMQAPPQPPPPQQPMTAPPQAPYVPPQQPYDAPTSALPVEVRAVLRPGESITAFTKIHVNRRFWIPAERPIGETIRVYVIGMEWFNEDGIKNHCFQVKPQGPISARLENGTPIIVNPGEIVLMPITAEIAKLQKLIANANQSVPDLIFRHRGAGALDVWCLNAMIARSIADQR